MRFGLRSWSGGKTQTDNEHVMKSVL